jgi:hypothetical protein
MFAALNSSSSTTVTDPQIKYVTTLLNGNGSNGSQNNTFVDSSTNNVTITRTGNVTQGTTTPFGNYWGQYYPGGTDYLTASGAALGYGTSDVTIECWIYRLQSGNPDSIYTGGRAPSASGGFGIKITSSNTIGWNTNTSSGFGASTVSVGVWHHIAVTRYSGTLRFFLDGVLDYYNASFTQNCTNTFCIIGKTDDTTPFYANMYISNFRLVVGSQVYPTSSTTIGATIFTPPTAPLTAVTGTVFLTAQNNLFIDNSSNAYPITQSGAVSVQRFNNFGFSSATIPYTTSNVGGAMYFDGTGDYLSSTAVAANQLTGDFTIECWVYPLTIGTQQGLINITNTTSSGANGLSVYLETSNRIAFYVNGNATVTRSATNTININGWYHIALVRSGTTNTLYINGVSSATSTNTPTWPATPTIGVGRVYNDNTSFVLNGYLSNARIVKGTAVYTANFTPPTAPLTAITNTHFLLNGTNAGIYDSAMTTIWETVGNAQVSTSIKKYGTGSMAFDGTGDWLIAPDNPSQQLPNNFTIEGWFYLNAIGAFSAIVSKGTTSTGWSVTTTVSNKLQFAYSSFTLTAATTLTASTWYYFAIVRSGTATGNVKIYLNGNLDFTSTTAINDIFNQTNPMYVGASRTGTTALNGYIDDLRITKGVARYSANFTPPTQPFPTS